MYDGYLSCHSCGKSKCRYTFMICRRKIFTAFLGLISFSALAQEFGGNPSSIKWQQVNTTAGRVIFPADLDSTGIRVGNIISFFNDKTRQTIGGKQKK